MRWYKYDIRDLTDAEYRKWHSLMSEEKRQKIDRFRFADDKKRTVAGEMLARIAIAKWCGVASEDIVFDKKDHGKPYAKDLTVEFNISHSADIVVCAVDDEPVGIDIEHIRPIDLIAARRICKDEELLYLFGRQPTEKDFTYTTDIETLTRFFEIWTAKEAYGKRIGTGLYDSKSLPSDCEQILSQPGYVISISKHM